MQPIRITSAPPSEQGISTSLDSSDEYLLN